MKTNYIDCQMHGKDNQGETLIVGLTRCSSSGETTIDVAQFKGLNVAWRKSITVEELRGYILSKEKRDDETKTTIDGAPVDGAL